LRFVVIIILVYFVFSSDPVNAQISRGGSPILERSSKAYSPPYSLDSETISNKISVFTREETLDSGKKTFPVAVDYELDATTETHGDWFRNPENKKIWRLEIYSHDAKGLSVFFSEFELNQDVMLYLYSPDFSTVLGGFNHLNNKKSGVLQTAFVPGESIVIELQVPADSDPGKIRIGSISHAFVDIYGDSYSEEKDGYFGKSGDCEVDINCEEGDPWQIVKYSVCRILFKRSTYSGTTACTGTLINSVSSDGTPFFYTANHCISSEIESETAVLYFDYESPACNGEDGDVIRTLSGTEILATSDSLDFTLLLLSDDPPASYSPYFAGWTTSVEPPQRSAAIHHPSGDVKKISIDNNTAVASYQDQNAPEWLYTESVPEAFWRVVNWEKGATEGGSSGAPLFNQNKLIAGNLTGGDASCSNPVNDYFSKFFLNWDYYDEPDKHLKTWLDPENTGASFIRGYDKYDIFDDLPIERFQVYPNPSTGIVTIHTDSLDLIGSSIRLFDLNGRVMGEYRMNVSQKYILTLDNFPNGIYIVEIRLDDYIVRKKIVLLK